MKFLTCMFFSSGTLVASNSRDRAPEGALDNTSEQVCEDTMVKLCGDYSEDNKPEFLECVFHNRKTLSEACNMKTKWPSTGACTPNELEICDMHPGESDITLCLKEHFNTLSSPCIKQFLRDHTAFLCLDDVNKICKKPGLKKGSVVQCLQDNVNELSDKCRVHMIGMSDILVMSTQDTEMKKQPFASPGATQPAPTNPPTSTILNILSTAPANGEMDASNFVAQVMASSLPRSAGTKNAASAQDVQVWLLSAGAVGTIVVAVVAMLLFVSRLLLSRQNEGNGLDVPLVDVKSDQLVVEVPQLEH